MPSRTRFVVFATASLVLVASAVLMLSELTGESETESGHNVVSLLFTSFATVCAITACKRGRGRQRVAWLCFSVGLSGAVVGDLIWAFYYLTQHAWPPFPGPADAAYLLLPASVAVAALLTTPGGLRSGLRLLLDGVIISTSSFLVAWTVGLREVYETSGVSALAFATAVTYPFADISMIAMLVIILTKTPKGSRLAPGLLTAGLTIIGITGAAVISVRSSPDLDPDVLVVGWAAGMLLIGAAGLTFRPQPQADPAQRRKPSRIALWLPYVPIPFAVVLGGAELSRVVGLGPILAAGITLVFASLLRQFVLLDENRRLLVTVADIALHDALTGLPNRALFHDRLTHAMTLRLRNAAPVAVLLMDLDDFKLVNDTLGHAAGDGLLRSVAGRMSASVRTFDTVARLGGDEFAVLIEDTPENAHAVAERVVHAFDEPFGVDGREVFVRPSVGLAVATSVSESDISADDLFRRADLAMYSAKRAQFNGVRTYTPDMRHDATQLEVHHEKLPGRRDGIARIQLLGDLRRAIDDRQLTLVYQPKFELSTSAVVGVEALVRWPHPTLGTLEPFDFLPLVKQNGLMDALTDVVVDRAVQEAAAWYAAGVHVPVAVNLSAPTLDDAELPDRLLAVLAKHGMAPDALTVEITEDVLLASLARTRTVLERLRGNGIRVAIDDFGSGFATMTYLRELPVDELKLDREFVAPMLHDLRAAAIVESVIKLADTFGIASVAEGVENEATADRLGEYGCGFVQGYYFSPPVSAPSIQRGIWGARLADDRVIAPVATRPSSA